ncbi:hypothetical protein CPLU01_03282 [Colletotrichum plurivorum]|uniref:AAA+ ATPase domain-containing protein n=1 Tax=Colletotrichum plurivorum TaxID=2175906 RepID=A0A8H6NLM4_9PEZI|nr:hypothetical protein CPLU01_03282 [Colletotrichum plurivorum]
MAPEVVQAIPRKQTPPPKEDSKMTRTTEADRSKCAGAEVGIDPVSDSACSSHPKTTTAEDVSSAASGYLKIVSNTAVPDDADEEAEEVRRSYLQSDFPPLFREVFDQEKRRGSLKLRAHQATLHHTLSYMRIEELERELFELENIVHGRDKHWEPPNKRRFPVYRHEKEVATEDGFRASLQTILLPAKQQAALEILVSDLVDLSTITNIVDAHPTDLGTYPKPERQQRAERVRIRSRALLWHLDKLAGGHLILPIREMRLEEKTVFSTLVFLRPFKYFVTNFAEIKQSLPTVRAKLEAEMARATDTSKSVNRKEEGEPPRFDNQDLLKDLEVLVNFLDVELQPTMHLCKQISDGTATTIETRAPDMGTKLDEDEKPERVHGFVVDCISLGTNGSSYLPKLHKIPIKKFYGSQPISSLSMYPLKFDPNAAALRAKFLKGGQRFLDITRDGFCHKLVSGKTLDEPSHDLESRVIVDMTMATATKEEWRLQPSLSTDDFTQPDKRETITIKPPWCFHRSEGCCGGDVIQKDLEIDVMKAQAFYQREARSFGPLREEDLLEDDLMLMHHFVYAFALRSRQWVTVLTEDLHEVVFENSFDDLVIPNSHGATVRALVETHENSRATPRSTSSSSKATTSIGTGLDLVKGKGAGLIILLHGPPGVGKTSTAECVADDTRRPLFPITCGDIGETAAEVEHNLQYNFRLADKWGCVLLLDEADVFLAKRTRSDLRHNAVTSVFLRSLEYYAGILFLTTNRVGAIDPAFKSRIQMSLFYPKLDLRVTKELYRKFIKRAKAEQDRTENWAFEIRKAEILKFAKEHFKDLTKKNRDTWNGRQIRNAFQTAIALTEHQGKTKKPGEPRPVLGEEQFKMVASGFEKFDEYLIHTLGFTDAVAAKREGWRDDAFSTAVAYQQMETPRHAYARQAMPRYRPSLSEDSDFEPDSDDDDDDEEDEDEDDDGRKKKRGKGAALKRADTGLAAAPAAAPGSFEEYQEWLKWKKLAE